LLDAAQTDDPQIGKTGIALVMFTDIVDSAVLATVSGDARWTTCVQRHIGQLTDIIETHTGKMIKSLGDGSMSTFTSAAAAMRAAQAIQNLLEADTTEPKLQIRIGVHTGDMIEAGDDFFGTVVNKAARVASAAIGGEIRVSDATKIMVDGSDAFDFEDMARVKLKGLAGDHTVYRLTWR
jgi:adenylate cyclase